MFGQFDEDTPWFAPKRYGIGTGLPIAWQGWLFLALHIVLIAGLIMLFHDRTLLLLATVLPAVLLPIPIYAAKTLGGWHWRWGKRD